jgi:hypothetical protein
MRMIRPLILFLVLPGIACPTLAFAQGAGEVLPGGFDRAIERGLMYLQKRQNQDKGSFDAEGPPNAMAGLAILSFLACGHTPDVGRHGLAVRRALDFLLNQDAPDGYFGGDGGRMYGHCIVTIALAEAYGTETDEPQRRRIRSALDNAMKVIYAAQDVQKGAADAGGWRYERHSTDSDLSVSVWCTIAMKACQNAGLTVPKERVDGAIRYTLRCFRKDQQGFAYRPGEDSSPAMTGAALLSLCLLGAEDRPEAPLARQYLLEKSITNETRFFYYATYYTTQAAFQTGGTTWTTLWQRNSESLIRLQRDDGSWPSKREELGREDARGRFYPTAMSVLTLSVPLRLLPIYQR